MNAANTPSSWRSNPSILPWIGSLFVLKPDQFRPVRGLVVVVIVFVPLLIVDAAGHTNLWLSFSFGLVFTALCDLVGRGAFPVRLRRALAFVLVGALLTALGVLLGGANWALVVSLVFATTLLSYLALAYGRSGFIVGDLLNI